MTRTPVTPDLVHHLVTGSHAEGTTSLAVAAAIEHHERVLLIAQPGEDLDHYPRVPQLPQSGTQYSEPELYWIVKHGIRHTAMSAYGPFYSEKQLWAIANFLRRINNLPPGVLDRIQAKQSPGGSNN